MDKKIIEQIIHMEINFCALFSGETVTDFGKMFCNPDNPLSWDSNHAVITARKADHAEVIRQVEAFYRSREMVPRIYYSFLPGENSLLDLLKQQQWQIHDMDYTFYTHSPGCRITEMDCAGFVPLTAYCQEIEDFILSDPLYGGVWNANVIRICLEKKNITAFGLRDSGKLVGLYQFHNANGVTRINNVLVHHALRGKGFGKRLAQHFIFRHYTDHPNDLLYLAASNPVAKHIYQQYGFSPIPMPGSSWNAHKP